MTELTYEEALKIEQHRALDIAVADGRITPEQKAISADLLDGVIDQAEADKRYAALTPDSVYE